MIDIDKYIEEKINRVDVPEKFRPHIITVYPPNNFEIFEEWFRENYIGCDTNRMYLDIFPTSYWVNNDYGNNQIARKEIQDYVGSLPLDKKYFSIAQYDNGFMLDWGGKDVLEFNMSKTNGVMMPLLCQPHPYTFDTMKLRAVSFVGSKTHKIRELMNVFKDNPDCCILFESVPIEEYCKILAESVYSLCPRGYGINSFRIQESLQYGAIPVWISDDFVHPWGLNFNDFGVLVNSRHAHPLPEILENIPQSEIESKQSKIKEVYEKYYTYEANLNHIIKYLENEK